jgi:uncharacterized metal-binding protein
MNGVAHASITAGATGAIIAAGYFSGLPAGDIVAAAGGCAAGIILTPDLDGTGTYHGRKLLKEYGGSVLALAWRILWFPYTEVIKHRSPVSHWPIFGTLVRILYLYGIYGLICFVIGLRPTTVPLPVFIPFFAGLAISDLLHFLADLVPGRTR